jgi:hypothetical protein
MSEPVGKIKNAARRGDLAVVTEKQRQAHPPWIRTVARLVTVISVSRAGYVLAVSWPQGELTVTERVNQHTERGARRWGRGQVHLVPLRKIQPEALSLLGREWPGLEAARDALRPLLK